MTKKQEIEVNVKITCEGVERKECDKSVVYNRKALHVVSDKKVPRKRLKQYFLCEGCFKQEALKRMNEIFQDEDVVKIYDRKTAWGNWAWAKKEDLCKK